MAAHDATWSAAVGGVLILALVGCSESSPIPLPSAPPTRPRAVVITPIYDENGDPTITHYSSNTEVTLTGDFVTGYGGTDAAAERSYLEEYTWSDPNSQWDIDLSFSSGDLPFGSSYPPAVDVSQARMMFGVIAPEVRTRSGSLLSVPSARPQLVSDGHSTRPVTLPSSSPPSPDMVAPGTRTASATGPTLAPASNPASALLATATAAHGDSVRRARRAAVAERFVVSPRGRARLLARLRAKFQESVGSAGTRLFTHRRGSREVRVTFDPAIGGITQTEALDGDRVVSRSVDRYVTVQGATVLSEVVTTVFDPKGAPIGTITEHHTDITIR